MSRGRLLNTFVGEVVEPGNAPYVDARRIWYARYDRRPAPIVRPQAPTTRRPPCRGRSDTAGSSSADDSGSSASHLHHDPPMPRRRPMLSRNLVAIDYGATGDIPL